MVKASSWRFQLSRLDFFCGSHGLRHLTGKSELSKWILGLSRDCVGISSIHCNTGACSGVLIVYGSVCTLPPFLEQQLRLAKPHISKSEGLRVGAVAVESWGCLGVTVLFPSVLNPQGVPSAGLHCNPEALNREPQTLNPKKSAVLNP